MSPAVPSAPSHSMRTFFTVWLGQLVSLLGTGAANVALLITMYDLTGSAAWVSGTLVATHGTQVFLALFTVRLILKRRTASAAVLEPVKA